MATTVKTSLTIFRHMFIKPITLMFYAVAVVASNKAWTSLTRRLSQDVEKHSNIAKLAYSLHRAQRSYL